MPEWPDVEAALRAFGANPPAPPAPVAELETRARGRARLRLVRAGVAMAVLAGGGGLGGALGAGDTVDLVGEPTAHFSPDAVPVYACPGEGELGELHRGDRVFVTGRHAGGEWLEVRSPFDRNARAWVAASVAVPDGPLDELPEAGCDEGQAAAAAPPTTTTTQPGVTTTTRRPRATTTTQPEATTTTSPATTTTTQPGGTTTTSTSPATTTTTLGDTTGPSIGTISASPSLIKEVGSCGPGSTTSTVSVTVTDSGSGVGSVTLSWSVGTKSGSPPMSASGDTYSVMLGPFATDTVGADENVALTVEATDGVGNTSTKAAPATTLRLKNC